MKGEPAPYYIEYEIDDISSMRAIARLGGIVDDLSDHSRTLRVQVRVGDYAFDSSRFVTAGSRRGAAPSPAPPFRSTTTTTPSAARSGWRPTRPTSAPSACSPRRRRRFRTARPPIRSRISRARRPSRRSCPSRRQRLPTADGSIARSSSPRSSSRNPDIDSSEVWISETHGTSFYLNSEGFKVVDAGLDRVPPRLRRRAGRRRHDRAATCTPRSRAASTICRRCRNW